mmetsp:Transcript_41266/g.75498  ORF Transcript_41266/g.75498 Transcript_41266/m.75498 type:complete len:95 (-) Transcript_41266:1041-1325(-)
MSLQRSQQTSQQKLRPRLQSVLFFQPVTFPKEVVGGEFGMFGRVNVIVLLDFVFRLTKSVMMDVQPILTSIHLEAALQGVIAPGILIPLEKLIA